MDRTNIISNITIKELHKSTGKNLYVPYKNEGNEKKIILNILFIMISSYSAGHPSLKTENFALKFAL